MTRLSRAALGAATVILALSVVLVTGMPYLRAPPRAATTTVAASTVTGGGVTLVSTAIDLPAGDAEFPTAPGSDLLEANCTGCHSASMILGQPPLKPAQWQAEVTKMREVYKAPVADRDVPAILGYLSAVSARRAAPPQP